MAKAKFERTKPHVNIGEQKVMQLQISRTSIKLQKRESVESLSLQHTQSMRQLRDTTHTLTAQDMLTTLRT